MSVPSTSDLLSQLRRHLPARFFAALSLLGGPSGQLAYLLLKVLHEFIPATTIGQATGIWLDLRARGQGIERAPGESNESLRTRLRNFEDMLTVASIKAAVNGLLAEETEDECELLEHFANRLVSDTEVIPHAFIAGHSYLLDDHNSFTIIVPDLGTIDHSAYPAIASEVDRIRAAGVRWTMIQES